MQLRITNERASELKLALEHQSYTVTVSSEVALQLLADRADMLEEIEQLQAVLKLDQELDWTGTICDRLNIIARENGLTECVDGPTGAVLACEIHGKISGLRAASDYTVAPERAVKYTCPECKQLCDGKRSHKTSGGKDCYWVHDRRGGWREIGDYSGQA